MSPRNLHAAVYGKNPAGGCASAAAAADDDGKARAKAIPRWCLTGETRGAGREEETRITVDVSDERNERTSSSGSIIQ